MEMQRAVLLYGGGLDSTALLLELVKGRKVIALHINYGQVAFLQERRAAQYWCGRHGVYYDTFFANLEHASPMASIVGGKGGDMMDGRNMALIAMGAMYASARGIHEVYVGFHQEPPDYPFPDATQQGLDAMQHAITVMCGAPIKLLAPFAGLPRFEIVRHAMTVDDKFLDETHTCYTNEYGGCGKCAHCIQKAEFVSQMRRV